MKIISKTKQFVKDHKKVFLIGAGVVGGITLYSIGREVGRLSVVKDFKDTTNIDISKPLAYGSFLETASSKGDEYLKHVNDTGYCVKADDMINALVMIQKSES